MGIAEADHGAVRLLNADSRHHVAVAPIFDGGGMGQMNNVKKKTPGLAWLYIAATFFLLWNFAAIYFYGVIFWQKLEVYNRGDVGDGMALIPALCYVISVKTMVSGVAGAIFLMMRSHQAKYLFFGPLWPI